MKLSPGTRYAVRLLLELGESKDPVSLGALSEKTGISLRALENVQTILKQNGVTSSSVGAKGGIILARSLEEVSLGQLIEWLEEGVEFSVCCGEKANECPQRDLCGTRSVWRGVSARVQAALNEILLADIFSQYGKEAFPPRGPSWADASLSGSLSATSRRG